MRASGILMHITSLPGPCGIGTMGIHARNFVDFLKRAGQTFWQILPLTPTGFGDSPYQSCSAYAGNPYLIDLPALVEEGLLKRNEIDSIAWCDRSDRVNFGIQYQNKLQVLGCAFERFPGGEEFDRFCRENSMWLPDYALYMALKEESGGAPWYRWEAGLKHRDADAVWQARQRLKERLRFYSFVQYTFFRQWNDLKEYAHENRVRIIGDVPIYVPYDSADVWADPELFQLDEKLDPVAVAGCPPDAFSEDGQLWGNPLYRWDAMKRDGYSWWLRRLEAAGNMYDVVRFDHFRGFESYWSVPFGDATARNGHWEKGPGMDFIQAVKKHLPELQMIAEDLGFLTPEVLQLRDDSGFPGMKVLEFAFDSEEPSEYLPHRQIPNSVCYTGTHDNMTVRQWLETASPKTAAYARAYMNLTETEGLNWGVIRTAMASVADLCIVQLQDYLNLGQEGRMNCPGLLSGENWTWRAEESAMLPDLAERICRLTRLYGRLPGEAVFNKEEWSVKR